MDTPDTTDVPDAMETPPSVDAPPTTEAPDPLDAPEPAEAADPDEAPAPTESPEQPALGETTPRDDAPAREAPEPFAAPEAVSAPESGFADHDEPSTPDVSETQSPTDDMDVPDPLEARNPFEVPNPERGENTAETAAVQSGYEGESLEAPEPPEPPDPLEAQERQDSADSLEIPKPAEPSDSGAASEPDEASERLEASRLSEGPERAEEVAPLEPFEAEQPEKSAIAPSEDTPVQGHIRDRIKSVFGDRSPQFREISELVDKPEFQVPERLLPPDRYGTPLDRPDGTRTPLFNGPPKREQTRQGALGDCGIIATLGAVAGHRPQDISNAIRENEDGTYEVHFHGAKSVGIGRYEPTGDSIRLTVTPDLPVYDEFPGMPVFADSVSTETAWAPIMEKAIAGLDQTWTDERRASWKVTHNRPDNLRTGYVRLDDGTKSDERAELLVQLTGLPAATWDVPTGYDYAGRKPERQVIDHFKEQLAGNFPIIVGSRRPKVNTQLPKGIVGGHAYEVTGVDDRRLIHLRNPYNRNHPTEPLTFKEFQTHFLPLYTTLEPK
ncbi:C2 family cysteine protease [Streptomyces sp. RY43-2]|uniref:C2 family cysteine protease n=1 Tax=Streptomyces macrolidinus TaxID=2952607 RepID=A0ABT0ZC41_9ACTN|nr:C2 family cysteine protease [Streptomyces macrolidinus]MCN9241344.1 C2 family cysteine protease [Streptomyces macrolidinus]